VDRVRESLTFPATKTSSAKRLSMNAPYSATDYGAAWVRLPMTKCAPILTPAWPPENSKLSSGSRRSGRQFTTAKTIATEQEILHRMREGKNQVEPVLSRPQAIAVADRHEHLNHAQKSVVEDVLSAPDRIQESKVLPARARPPRSRSSAARRNHRAIKSKASPRPPAPRSNWSRPVSTPEHCKGFLPVDRTRNTIQNRNDFL